MAAKKINAILFMPLATKCLPLSWHLCFAGRGVQVFACWIGSGYWFKLKLLPNGSFPHAPQYIPHSFSCRKREADSVKISVRSWYQTLSSRSNADLQCSQISQQHLSPLAIGIRLLFYTSYSNLGCPCFCFSLQISYPSKDAGHWKELKTFTRNALLFWLPSEEVNRELTQQEVDPVLHSLLFHLSCLICFPSSTILFSLSFQEFKHVAEQTAQAFRSSCESHLLGSTKKS